MNDPVIFPCREEIKPEAGISPEGRAALALAWAEQDGVELEVEGDDDPDPPAACPGCTDADCDCEGVSECERCGAIPATAHGTTGADEVVYLCRPCWQADHPDCGGPDYPAASPDPGDDRPSRIVVHVGAVRVEVIRGVPPGTPQRKRPVSYLHPEHGWYAQYAGERAGYYPGACRRARRETEIAAHRDGVRQIGRYELLQAERRGLRDALLCGAAGLSLDWSGLPDPQDDTTEETLPQDLPGWEPWPERDPQVCDPVVAYPAGDYRIGDAEDLLGGATTLRALTACPSEISDGGTEVLRSHLDPVPSPAPSACPAALTFYLAYDSSGTRIGQPSGAAGMALSRALDELAEIYRDLGELGWGEEAERLDEARADLHLLRVTLSGALTPAALAALTGLDSSDAEAIPRAAELLQRLQREALPSPTPAELARLMCAAVGVGRQQELAQALLTGDETRIRYLQLALLRPGAL